MCLAAGVEPGSRTAGQASRSRKSVMEISYVTSVPWVRAQRGHVTSTGRCYRVAELIEKRAIYNNALPSHD